MKVAIMQPYLFPYFGYYQMAASVDKFVFLDDVNYITRGWINRNKIISSNRHELYFTVPLNKSSRNKLINQVNISEDFARWKKKFLKTVTHAYKKSPEFDTTYRLVNKILSHDSKKISDISCKSIVDVSRHLGIETEFLWSSKIGCMGKREEKIINICKALGADQYINAIGGKSLYDKKLFLENDLKLDFIRSTRPFDYLSIIHVMMKYFDQIDLESFVLE